MRFQWWSLLVSAFVLAACDKTPPPPTVEPGPSETISGSERLGWTQAAADAVELATFRYAIYVDGGNRSELTGASCTRSASDATFTCSAPLPTLSVGSHTLQLASFIVDGSVLESPRSASLQVTVSRPLTPPAEKISLTPAGAAKPVRDARLRVDPIASGVVDPTDLAWTPDGRLFVAEQGGRIRVVRDGRLLPAPALSLPPRRSDSERLLAIAVDPDFRRTSFVYAIYTAASRRGELAFHVARFREASDTLADAVILMDDVLASPSRPTASLRFGPDGKLFAAFDEGGDLRRVDDRASFNGKILRLNPDGTTPRDQPGATPVRASGYTAVRGMGWNGGAPGLWVADVSATGKGRLVVEPEAGELRRTVFALPADTIPSALAVHPDAGLLIGSDEGRHLLRLRVDPKEPDRIASTEHLLEDRIGGIRALCVAPDGSVYLATATTIWRLVWQA